MNSLIIYTPPTSTEPLHQREFGDFSKSTPLVNSTYFDDSLIHYRYKDEAND